MINDNNRYEFYTEIIEFREKYTVWRLYQNVGTIKSANHIHTCCDDQTRLASSISSNVHGNRIHSCAFATIFSQTYQFVREILD